jgi:hypothetical protein
MKRFQTDETLSDYGLHRKDCYSMPRLNSGMATKLVGVAERVGRMIDWQWVSGALEKHVANGDRPISISFT